MPLPSEQHQNTTSEYTPCKTDTHRGMIKHMLGCLGKALPDRSLFNMSDYIIQHVVAADNEEGALFAFTCTSDYAAMAHKLDIPKSKLGMCIDSGASKDYCPDCTKSLTCQMDQEKPVLSSKMPSMHLIWCLHLYL